MQTSRFVTQCMWCVHASYNNTAGRHYLAKHHHQQNQWSSESVSYSTASVLICCFHFTIRSIVWFKHSQLKHLCCSTAALTATHSPHRHQLAWMARASITPCLPSMMSSVVRSVSTDGWHLGIHHLAWWTTHSQQNRPLSLVRQTIFSWFCSL